jgi:hypothetical protein
MIWVNVHWHCGQHGDERAADPVPDHHEQPNDEQPDAEPDAEQQEFSEQIDGPRVADGTVFVAAVVCIDVTV